jgi:hypothetical protein
MAKVREAKTGYFLTSRGERSGRASAASALAKGFITGVGSATLVAEATKMTHRPYKGRGLKGDWAAVGDSLRRARAAG